MKEFDRKVIFETHNYTIESLVQKIVNKEIALPNIQRNYIWKTGKIVALFKSLWDGYPIGYFILWAINNQDKQYAKQLGQESVLDTNKSDSRLQYLLIDGQQRLTTIFKAFNMDILYFDPKTAKFTTSKMKKGFLPIRSVFKTGLINSYKEYIENNWTPNKNTKFPNDLNEEFNLKNIELNLERLNEIKNYSIPVIILNKEIDATKACDIFCLINSAGTRLNANDFLISLLALYAGHLKNDLEIFIEKTKRPNEIPYNVFWQPEITQMIRVLSWIAFYKDPLDVFNEIKTTTRLKKGAIINRFTDCLNTITNPNHWFNFIKLIQSLCLPSGFKGGYNFTYGYVLYTLYIEEYGEKNIHEAKHIFKTWILFTTLTSRYSGNLSKAIFKKDIKNFFFNEQRLNVEDFKDKIQQIIKQELTDDYWNSILPLKIRNDSNVKSNLFSIYLSALITFNVPSMFSNETLMLQSSIMINKNELEFHHLYPISYLKKIGINQKDKKDMNCIANYAWINANVNRKISNSKPSEYFKELLNTYLDEKKTLNDAEMENYKKNFYFYYALYENWEQDDKDITDFHTFLSKRSKNMSMVIKKLFVD